MTTPADRKERVLILGAGNTIMADEGIGPVALETLHNAFDFPPEVELMDVATTGVAMLSYLEGYDHLIIIDAAKDSGHAPGTVIFYTPEDLDSQQVMHSAHDQRLTDVLRAAVMSGIELKSVVIVGVQIAVLAEWILELSEPVEAAIPVACAATLHSLSNLGYEATPKPEADTNAILEALADYAPEGE